LAFIFFFEFVDNSELLIAFSGLASICFASVAALYQKRLKRLLAYSAISHTGFILLSISCNSIDSIKSLVIYTAIYIIMTLSTFSVVFMAANNNKIPKFLVNWTSLASQNLCLALTFSCILFSVAGIPPLAGFYSKLCVFGSLLLKDYVLTPACMAVFSSIACFYYIRLIRIFFFTESPKTKFWVGRGNSGNEVFLSSCVILITFFLVRSSALVDLSILIGLFLV
jgi:NADH-quinone oxidoreductase subunit N